MVHSVVCCKQRIASETGKLPSRLFGTNRAQYAWVSCRGLTKGEPFTIMLMAFGATGMVVDVGLLLWLRWTSTREMPCVKRRSCRMLGQSRLKYEY